LKKKGIILTIVFIVLLQPVLLSAQADGGAAVLKEGITQFQNMVYDQALLTFREIILNPAYSRFHGDAYYWTIKAYIALEQFDTAAKNIEFFLQTYPSHQAFPEMVYQKGRVLFLQKDYENAILVLKEFLESYPSSPTRPTRSSG
jgi:TolA-binding protein